MFGRATITLGIGPHSSCLSNTFLFGNFIGSSRWKLDRLRLAIEIATLGTSFSVLSLRDLVTVRIH